MMYELSEERINIAISRVQDASKEMAKSERMKDLFDTLDDIIFEDTNMVVPDDQKVIGVKLAAIALCYAAYLESD